MHTGTPVRQLTPSALECTSVKVLLYANNTLCFSMTEVNLEHGNVDS
jgi:hypothetical protein